MLLQNFSYLLQWHIFPGPILSEYSCSTLRQASGMSAVILIMVSKKAELSGNPRLAYFPKPCRRSNEWECDELLYRLIHSDFQIYDNYSYGIDFFHDFFCRVSLLSQ